MRQFSHDAGPAKSQVAPSTSSTLANAAWEPEVRPEDVESPEGQARARELVLQAQRRDTMAFPAFMERASNAAYDASTSLGSSLPCWQSLQDGNVDTLKYSLRFGPIMCMFLRETSAEYGKGTTCIWAQKDSCADRVFTDAD